MVAVTGHVGAGSGVDTFRSPSTPLGMVCPSPVPNRTTTDPDAAGLALELTELSWFRIAPWPFPEASAENSAGAVETTGSGARLDVTPLYITCTCVVSSPAIS